MKINRILIISIAITFIYFKFYIPDRYGCHIKKVLFSPDDCIKKHLIQLIKKEQKSIKCAIYILTDSDIADTLIQAKKRNVILEIIIDQHCQTNSQIQRLQKNNITILVYKYTKSIMHHKFILFEKQNTVWTGSFNFTYSANNKNQENVIALEDKNTFQAYNQKFEELKNLILEEATINFKRNNTINSALII